MTQQQDQSPLAQGWESIEGNAVARPALDTMAGKANWKGRLSETTSLRLLGSLFRRIIQSGTLVVLTPGGARSVFGIGEPSVTIRLTDWATVRHMFFNPDMAFGESYMDGTLVIEQGDIYGFLDLCLANIGWGRGHWLRNLWALLHRAGRRVAQYNPVARANANAAHHYDLSDALYELFLDSDRQYSCAYYRTAADTLEQAQEQKKQHLAAKLLLRPGQRVLDIGSGWGGLARYLARTAGVDVTGMTLSVEQHAYAQRRIKESGLEGRVRSCLGDYRSECRRYDRIVSVGMFEHVGIGHYREYFQKVRDMLEDDGVALVHTIGRCDGAGAAHPWINKYIFPGGYTPALSEVLPVIEKVGLHVTDIEILRLHYAETIRAWRQRFRTHRGRAERLYDRRFCRMWEFYLASCEASFRHSGLAVFQIQLSRRIDSVPMTRDYIADWERGQAAAHLELSTTEASPWDALNKSRVVIPAKAGIQSFQSPGPRPSPG